MKRIALLSVVSVMLIACQDNQGAEKVETPQVEVKQGNVEPATQTASLTELKLQLDQLTENKQCSSDTACRVLPVGKRACGGPAGFVVFSTEHSDEEAVSKVSSQITALEIAQNLSTNAMSICEHLSEPAVQCIANTCSTTDGTNPAF